MSNKSVVLLTSLLRVFLTRSLKPFILENKCTDTLNFANEQNLGIYVHIPFCRSLCSFCPYCKVVYGHDVAAAYRKAVLDEIDMVGSRLTEKKQVTSLYFGGGTPALMVDSLKDIIDCLKKYFIISQGIGIELHPDDITAAMIKQLKEAGITMVSVGIQSFNENCLSELGRENNGLIDKLELLGQTNFDVIDVDLIFAIPCQTENILIADIETAFSSGATQVSTYPFIDFIFARNSHKPLPEKEKKKMLSAVSRYCKQTGRMRTSVWTFAKKNTEKYSSITRDNYLGFGVSAATLLRNVFKINTFSIEAYLDRIKNHQLATSLTLTFTLRQRAVYYLFWNTYAMLIDPVKFNKYFGMPLVKLFGFELWLSIKLGLIREKNKSYHLTEKGAYYYHIIEQTYTKAYISKMWDISRVTAFPETIVLK